MLNMTISETIVDFLNRNRVSTTEVADVLGKTGNIPGVIPCNKGHYCAGIVNWVYAYGESNWSVHEQIQSVDENSIVFVDNYECFDRAIFGELVSKYLILYQQCKGIVVNGYMRDAAALIKENWPIWCRGYNPVGCFNQRPTMVINKMWVAEQQKKYEGSIAVCDDCGVVIIPAQVQSEGFLDALWKIEDQEDIWFDRLDHFKESTFEIVCQKKYLQDDLYMDRRRKSIIK